MFVWFSLFVSKCVDFYNIFIILQKNFKYVSDNLFVKKLYIDYFLVFPNHRPFFYKYNVVFFSSPLDISSPLVDMSQPNHV